MAKNSNKIQEKINALIQKIDLSIERIETYLQAPDIEDAIKEANADVETITQLEPVLKKIKTPVAKEEYKNLHILKQLLIQLQENKAFENVEILDTIEKKLEELSSSE